MCQNRIKITTLFTLLIALLLFSLGNCQLELSNETYAGAVTLQGYVYDYMTNEELTPSTVKIIYGSEEISGTIDNHFFYIPGIPSSAEDVRLQIENTGYLNYREIHTLDGTLTDVGDIFLIPDKRITNEITVELRDFWGSALAGGTLSLEYSDFNDASLPKEVTDTSVAITSGTATYTIDASTLFPGLYNIILINGMDHNSISYQYKLDETTLGTVNLTEKNTYISVNLGGEDYYPDPPFATSRINVSGATNVKDHDTDDQRCDLETQAASIKFTFSSPIVVNYFTGGDPGINAVFDCEDSGGFQVPNLNSLTIEETTIYTTGSTTLTIKHDADLSDIATDCEIRPDVEIRFVEFAGDSFTLEELFLTTAAGKLEEPGCETDIKRWKIN